MAGMSSHFTRRLPVINCSLHDLALTSIRYAIVFYLPHSVSEHLIQFGESQLVPKSKLPQIIQAVIRFVRPQLHSLCIRAAQLKYLFRTGLQ